MAELAADGEGISGDELKNFVGMVLFPGLDCKILMFRWEINVRFCFVIFCGDEQLYEKRHDYPAGDE